MKLLLGLPEFTSGFHVQARSSPFGQLRVIGEPLRADGVPHISACVWTSGGVRGLEPGGAAPPVGFEHGGPIRGSHSAPLSPGRLATHYHRPQTISFVRTALQTVKRLADRVIQLLGLYIYPRSRDLHQSTS